MTSCAGVELYNKYRTAVHLGVIDLNFKRSAEQRQLVKQYYRGLHTSRPCVNGRGEAIYNQSAEVDGLKTFSTLLLLSKEHREAPKCFVVLAGNQKRFRRQQVSAFHKQYVRQFQQKETTYEEDAFRAYLTYLINA